jgi:hypothetical protein
MVMETVKDFFYNLFPTIPKSLDELEFPDKYYQGLKHLAAFVVRARSGVIRESYRKELVYIPPPEASARIAKQLATLCFGLAIIDGRKKVNINDYLLAVKTGFDSVLTQRMQVINFLCGSDIAPLPEYSTSSVSKGIGYSTQGARIILEDLAAHKLISVEKTQNLHKWSISEFGLDLLVGSIKPIKEIVSNLNNKNIDFAYKNILNFAIS